jgi:glycosyltransferase involved in cell wall biosynthesis
LQDIIATVGIPVIPQREPYTKLCFESILKQEFTQPFEILIIEHPGYQFTITNLIPEHITINHVGSGPSLAAKRNDILAHALGKYILFIDDDIIAEKNWLSTMVAAAENNSLDIFWGAVRPIFEKEIPRHLIPFEMCIGGFHYDSHGRLRLKGMIGCNFGIKNGLEHTRGQFVETLGRGSEIRSGEETLFLKEYCGKSIRFIEDAIVYHYINSNRINYSYILYNQYNNALATVYINKLIKANNKKYGLDIIASLIKSMVPQKSYLKKIFLRLFIFWGYVKGIIKYSLYEIRIIL